MGKHVQVIAEAGVNHNGRLDLAKELAESARDAGADFVKFQVFDTKNLVAKGASKADYQKSATGSKETQDEMLKKLELSHADFVRLRDYCDHIGIQFLATSFDCQSTSFLVNELGVDILKIPSGEMDNWPYLVQIASYGLPIIMSTGMASASEVVGSVSVLKEHGAGEITVLHCNTQYPTPYEDVNLSAMPILGETCGCAYGYSDHTKGIEVPIAAVALGATVIEKHFTIDRNLEGPDHMASLEPRELEAMVQAIRVIERALGDSKKRVTESEAGNRPIVRKSIRASRRIAKGEVLAENNLVTKRPGDGLSPMLWPYVIGTKAIRDFNEDEGIEL